MNQIKYSAYALLLVLGIASIALFINNLSFPSRTSSTNASQPSVTKAVVNVEGKNLFQSNCQTCHAINKILTGPALAGVETRGPWTDRKNIMKWVKNPAATINVFPYTKQLFQEFNGQIMPSFPMLSEKEIKSIFDYIKEAETASMQVIS